METLSEPSKESLLEFDDVRLAFLNVFPLPINENITREQAIEVSKDRDIKAVWDLPYSKDFKIAEDFLLPQRIAGEYFRIQLNDFRMSFATVSEQGPIDTTLVKVFLVIYPKIGMGILLFNLRLNKCNVDDLIFLQQSLDGRFKISIVFSPPFGKPKTSNVSLKEVAQQYVKWTLLAFDVTIEKPKILTSRCVEVRGFSNLRMDNPEELFENFPQQIYGLLVADEGWRFVPSETAKARFQLKWRTRSFLSVVSFAFCVVLVNLEEKETYKEYATSQQRIRKKYGYEAEEYFSFSPEIAGLKHGPLLMLENASVRRFILEQLSERIIEMKPRSIKELLSVRENFSDAFGKLSRIKIPEMGLLGQTVQEAMMISTGIEEAKKTLEEVERTLVIKYNEKINLRVLILTLVSLGCGILGILIQTGLLNQLLDILAN